jgi:sugar lactone lactonase YvrE
VIDSHPKESGNRKIWAFDLAADGSLSKQRVVYDFGKGRGGDGMRVDLNGNLWVAAGINKPRGNPGESLDVPAGVYVISPGQPAPANVSKCMPGWMRRIIRRGAKWLTGCLANCISNPTLPVYPRKREKTLENKGFSHFPDNSRNDSCVDAKGRIWFTDPRYGADRSDLEMDVEAV